MNQVETETICRPLMETVKGFVVPAPSSQRMGTGTPKIRPQNLQEPDSQENASKRQNSFVHSTYLNNKKQKWQNSFLSEGYFM